MERWELIERFVLLAIGAALLSLAGWLVFFRNGPERFAWMALLIPCIYWVFWQALYEDKLESKEPPSAAERAMWALWLWSRRLVLGGISALCAFGMWKSISDGYDYGAVLAFGVLTIMAGWVAVFGAGKNKSTADDRSIHQTRMNRYK